MDKGAGVGNTTIGTKTDAEMSDYADFVEREGLDVNRLTPELERHMTEKYEAQLRKVQSPVHAIPLTDAIRAAVAQGQPLYRDIDTAPTPMLQGATNETTTATSQSAAAAPARGADNANRGRAGLRDLSERAWRPRLRAAQSGIRARNDISERAKQDWDRTEVDEDFGATPEFAEAQQYAAARGLTAVPVTNAPFTGCLFRDTMFIGRASKPAIVTARHELFHNLVRNKNDAALEIVRRFNIANRAAREFQRTMSRRYTDRGRAAPSMELTAEEAAAGAVLGHRPIPRVDEDVDAGGWKHHSARRVVRRARNVAIH
jgi:hypothetical protein